MSKFYYEVSTGNSGDPAESKPPRSRFFPPSVVHRHTSFSRPQAPKSWLSQSDQKKGGKTRTGPPKETNRIQWSVDLIFSQQRYHWHPVDSRSGLLLVHHASMRIGAAHHIKQPGVTQQKLMPFACLFENSIFYNHKRGKNIAPWVHDPSHSNDTSSIKISRRSWGLGI